MQRISTAFLTTAVCIAFAMPGKADPELSGYGEISGDWRLGGLVSVGNSDLIYRRNNRLVTGAAEAAWYIDRLTLFTQAGYSRAIAGDFADIDLESWQAHGGARYFLQDNLMLQADLGLDASRGELHTRGTSTSIFGTYPTACR